MMLGFDTAWARCTRSSIRQHCIRCRTDRGRMSA